MTKIIYKLGVFSQICLFYLATTTAANAQIVPDTTLPSNSIVTPQGNTSLIEGGTTAGTNLFHSFETFSLPTGGTAFFNNALNIQNIFSRVTGNTISNIDGLIRANGTANLFLLNPNGIIFGPNARLNIGGSFLGSTATTINFADGSFFSTNPVAQTTPLLTISLPIGLQYGSNSGNIQMQGSTLQVNNGNTLALIGGNVSLNSGQLLAPAGRIELGSVADTSKIELSVNNSPLALTYPQQVPLLDISIDNGTQVNVRASGGGNISINARSLNMTGTTTQLQAGIASDLGAVDAAAGDIQINATDAIHINGSRIFNDLEKGSVGKAGHININTGSLSLTNGAEISASAYGQGEAGNITINARDTISLDGVGSDGTSGGIYSSLQEGAVGKSGEIKIDTGSLIVTNGALVAVDTKGQGDGGNVIINARNNISFDGVGSNGNSSGAGSIVFNTAVGKGGDVSITTGSLSFTNGGALDVSTFGQGDGGNVTVIARDSISVDGMGNQFPSGIYNRVEKGGVGNGGSINIITRSLSLTNGAVMDASTFGQGNAGNLTIDAQDTIFLDRDSRAVSFVEKEAVGNSGSLSITTGSLSVFNGSLLAVSTFGQGNAGNLTIIARDTISFDGVDSSGIPSAAGSRVESGAVGNGGDVQITTGSLFLTNGGDLNASTFGQGNAGNMTIIARDTISFDGVGSNGFSSGAFSTVQSGAVGNAGKINITTGSLSMTNGGGVGVSTFGQGNGGNVTINARDTISFDGVDSSGIPSAALNRVESGAVGNGGSINITAGSVKVTHGGGVGASTYGRGDGGNITINARDSISLDGIGITGFPSAVGSRVESGAVGNSGNVHITTGSLSVSNGALVTASTLGKGNAGSVTINARDTISLSEDGKASSFVEPGAVGNGGNINITTGSLFQSNGGLVAASTFGQGNGGNVTINARDTISFDGVGSNGFPSGVLNRVESGAVGNGGSINITAGSVKVTHGGGVGASSYGRGDGGNITINARDSISLDGGNNRFLTGAGSLVEAEGVGNAGDINITTGSLSVSNGSILTVSNQGKGAAGNFQVIARSIYLDNNAQITANTVGGEGNIRLDAQSLQLLHNSKITTNATGSTVTGGNIILNANTIAALYNSDISANSEESFGGKVIISSQGIFGTQFRPSPTPESDITASGGNPALSGSVQINTPNINPSSGLVRLSAGVVDTENQIAASCAVKNQNEFTVTGRGGLPTNPKDSLFSAAIWLDLRDVDGILQTISSRKDSLPNNRASVPTPQLVEAQGWIINTKGEVVLSANPTTVTPQRPALAQPRC